MTVINTNVSALVAQNAMTVNSRAQSAAMQQLSTGLRINGAKDDAAGLAIASKMTSQIRGLDQAVRNANDGISLFQTADGGMVEVSNMLQRMREIAVQSANDTNTTDDRTALNGEFTQLKTEINRIATSTQWNGMNILDASTNSGSFTFQIGANNSTAQQVQVTIGSIATQASATGVALVAHTTAAASSAKQLETVELTTAPVAGETIQLSVGGAAFQYTVTTADLSPGSANGDLDAIATSVANAFNANSTFNGATGYVAAADLVTHKFTVASKVDDTRFNFSATVVGAGLSVAGAAAVTTIDTQANAQTAITNLDGAIKNVNSSRANLGAMINRFTYAADNMATISGNTAASRSRILDTDYAKASSELARTQIIAQASTAMLAQANQSQQSVLALLK
jgi:flagellin